MHLAAAIRDQPAGSIEELNGIATWRMVRAAERAGVEHFVFMSSLGAVRHDRTRFLRAKALAESAVLASDVRHTVFAPSMVYAPGDMFMTLLERLALLLPVDAGQRPRAGALPADLGRGRRRLRRGRARRSRRGRRRPRALRARRARRRCRTSRSSSSCCARPAARGRRQRARRRSSAAALRVIETLMKSRVAGDVGRGRAARGLDDCRPAARPTPRRSASRRGRWRPCSAHEQPRARARAPRAAHRGRRRPGGGGHADVCGRGRPRPPPPVHEPQPDGVAEEGRRRAASVDVGLQGDAAAAATRLYLRRAAGAGGRRPPSRSSATATPCTGGLRWTSSRRPRAGGRSR